MVLTVVFGVLFAVAIGRVIFVGRQFSQSRQAPLSPDWKPAPPPPRKPRSLLRAFIFTVTATANVSGFYYLMSPGYQFASVDLALNVWADDADYAPDYMPQASTPIFGEGFFFSAGRDWNYISGQYQATVTFPAYDTPTYYAIGAGTTQKVMAGLGCIAALDAATTIQSITVELIS
jgi:hypothetical protein